MHSARLPRDVRPRLPSLLAIALTTALSLSGHASAETLPIATGEKSKITGAIQPVGDTDTFGFDLGVGDQLSVKLKDVGPGGGLFATLVLRDPVGVDRQVAVSRQGTGRPSFKYVATVPGTHSMTVSGDPGGFGGAEGGYRLTTKIKRSKPPKLTFDDPAGGNISVPFVVPEGTLIDVSAKTKKGAFDITGLIRPDGTPDPNFLDAFVAKANGRSGKAKKFAPLGGFGTYELQGTHIAGAKVKVTIKLRLQKKARKASLSDGEPDFDQFIDPFPGEGLPGTMVTVIGRNFEFVDLENGPDILPSFRVGNIDVPMELVERPFDQVYRFPIPAGSTPGSMLDIRVLNSDGQGAIAPDAFHHVPLAQISGLSETTAGPAGGRSIRISGQDFRGGSVVLFNDTVVQPERVLDDRVDVVAPPNSPGDVSVAVRDEFGQTVTATDMLTYLDVGSNAILTVTPNVVQGIGGEDVVVDGVDFSAQSVLSLDGDVLDTTLVSPERLTFTMPQHVAGSFTLEVIDDLEQSSSRTLRVDGFEENSNGVIPAPNTGAGVVDGWRATRILRGDVNDDSNLDLVELRPAAAFGDSAQRSRTRILLSSGSGTYTDGTSGIPGVTATDDWRAIDGVLFKANNDNHLDLAIITQDDLGNNRSSLRLLINDGNGNFTDETTTSIPAATSAGDRNQGLAVVAVDVDKDGDDDLVILHDQFFQETIDISPPPPDPLPDPPPDPVLLTLYYPGVRVLINDNGSFSRDDAAIPDVEPDDHTQLQGCALASADFDNDGWLDLILTIDTVRVDPDDANSFLRSAILLRNQQDGSFDDESDMYLPNPQGADYLQADRIIAQNLSGNAQPELTFVSNTKLVDPTDGSTPDAPATRIYENDGSGNFTAASSSIYPESDDDDQLQADDVAFADLNFDGLLDMVLISARAPNRDDRALRVLVQSNGAYVRGSDGLPNPLTGDDGRGAEVLVFDVDGDGDIDILTGRDESDETVRNTLIFENPRN